MPKYSERLINSFLTFVKVSDIAKDTGLTERTVRRYRADPELQRIIRERQSELVSEAVSTLRGNLNDSAQALVDIINDSGTPPQVRVNAIQTLMKQCNEWMTFEDIDRRLQALESTNLSILSEYEPDRR